MFVLIDESGDNEVVKSRFEKAFSHQGGEGVARSAEGD